MGVAPRRLWGWEPREFHEYVYEDGHLVGAVVTREAEFTDHQVALLLAHKRALSDLGSHGLPMSETTDPKNQFAYRAADMPSMDWAAVELGKKQDAYYKANPNTPRHGHLWSVKKKT